MPGAYYNEFDPFAAAWLRELIADGHIAPGEVDTRSIEDVSPDDLRGFAQCHFFAGIGVWSLALRNAGWADDRPIWTGSCPCQPFSAAGKGGGFADERHLWPAFHHLIEQCRPDVVAGEQVASKDGLGWLDLVQTDLEGTGYAFGAVDTCAAGFGAPHIRQRLYWIGVGLADSISTGLAQRERLAGVLGGSSGADAREAAFGSGVRSTGRMAHTDGRDASAERQQRGGKQRQQPQDGGAVKRLEHTESNGRQPRRPEPSERSVAAGCSVGGMADPKHTERRPECEIDGEAHRRNGFGRCGDAGVAGPTNGLWRDADWLGCRDGKWRPVKPGTFPLANAGAFRNRVGELRGAGNAINAAQAQGFIEAFIGDVGVGA